MGRLLLLISLICLFQCTSLEDASPVSRNTFLRFYERGYNYTGKAIEVLADGYLLAGDVQSGLSTNSIITRTDLQGNIIWENEINNASTYSLLVTKIDKVRNVTGYFILGASIEVDPTAEQVNDIVKYKGLITVINETGKITKQHILKNSKNLRADFIGNTLTTDGTNIFAVGTMKIPSQQTKAFTIGVDTTSLDTLWYKEFTLIDRDYVNAKSSFVTNSGNLIWTASAKTTQQNKSYLCVPVVTPKSTFVNNNPFGSFEDRYYSGDDIKKNASGYGAIGTYYNTQSQSSNMYFVRLDVAGNLITGSEEFFDAAISDSPKTDKDISSTQDTGDALTTTTDGGYLLAGSMVTTPEVGNGGTDLFLIRLDAFGNVLWKKILGGTGDETVRNVRTTDDGGFILCGTSTIAGLSSAFLMKINKDGDLKD